MLKLSKTAGCLALGAVLLAPMLAAPETAEGQVIRRYRTTTRYSSSRTDFDRDGIRNSRDRDIDGDGIPNYRDRNDYSPRSSYRYTRRNDMDRDGIRNNRDRDIDGDGIRNTRDRHDSNRYRR